MDSLGLNGHVAEERSWKRRSCRGRIVLEKTVLWWTDRLGKDGLVGDR
jgi:hypothetical protein